MNRKQGGRFSNNSNSLFRRILSIFLPLVIGLFAAVPVSGLELLDRFRDIFGTVFLGDYFQADIIFWMKFLLFWLLFSVLFFVAQTRLFTERRNIAMVVAFIVSFIGIIPMPADWVMVIFTLWNGMIGIILIVVPLIGVVYTVHNIFDQPRRLDYMLKAVFYYILAASIYRLWVTSTTIGGPIATIGGFQGAAELAYIVCLIIMFWNIFRAIVGGPNEQGPGPQPPPPGGQRPAQQHQQQQQQPQQPQPAFPGQPPGQQPQPGLTPQQLHLLEQWFRQSMTQLGRQVAQYQHDYTNFENAMRNVRTAADFTPQHHQLAALLDRNATRITNNFRTIANYPHFHFLSQQSQTTFTNAIQQWAQLYVQFANLRVRMRNNTGVVI